MDEAKLGAFAGALNACDFSLQLLVRQRPPDLSRLQRELEDAQSEDLPVQTQVAAESSRCLLEELESRHGILDRRFYAICEQEHAGELRSVLTRTGLKVQPLRDDSLHRLVIAASLGGTPSDRAADSVANVQINRAEIEVDGRLQRSVHLTKWPRSLAPGILQQLMSIGAPMDLSLHLGPVPPAPAAR